MPPKSEPHPGVTQYPLRFGAAAFLFVSITLVLVLFVIPERYVLQRGFRESGMNVPAPTTPFTPLAAVAVPARSLPGAPAEIRPGPAEVLWEEATPLLRTGRHDEALPLLERYLGEHPLDADVRRELVVSLLSSGRAAEAVTELQALLARAPDEELALLLARTLRDEDRLGEASSEYARLSGARPDDEALTLEWARAHAWAGAHERTAHILEAALARTPGRGGLQVELARAYYALGRLADALAVLRATSRSELAGTDAADLEASVLRASLSIPPVVVEAPPPPTPLEQAMAARLDGQLQRARTLLEEALASAPADRELWLAYADLLEYEVGDGEGASSALLEAERLGGLDPSLQLRLARLDVWSGRSDDAEQRLEGLLAALDRGAIGSAIVPRTDVLALLGDLRRWQGDRTAAASLYERALHADRDHEAAGAGLDALRSEQAAQLAELEAPGVSATAYTLADSDDFLRVDAGGSWARVTDGRWVWAGTIGRRWLRGYDLTGSGALREGVFANFEAARWWRWGTLRTGLHLGAQRLRTAWDVEAGVSLRHRGTGGADTELTLEHAPAYPLASTLQSVMAELVHERLTLTHSRRVGDRWALSGALDAARLRPADPRAFPDAEPTGRVQLAVSAGRASSESLTLGMATHALAFTGPAPRTAAGTGGRPLFWDPTWSLSVGPYGSVDHELGPRWRLVGRLNPGLALVDERRAGADTELVPHLSLDAGVRHQGERLTTSLELFYYQGQLSGYRSYGARITVGPGGSNPRGAP
ncbi:MAG TPA: tetratricopeptide repeat protein [Longimicrobiales bacterium]|nr:tetratricopeptide repeat protein [Longimicrobiales bacterium]